MSRTKFKLPEGVGRFRIKPFLEATDQPNRSTLKALVHGDRVQAFLSGKQRLINGMLNSLNCSQFPEAKLLIRVEKVVFIVLEFRECV